MPSEVVIPPAAFLAAQGHLNFSGVIIAGTVGSYLGSAITYWVSRLLGRPLILRYGRLYCSPLKNSSGPRFGWNDTKAAAFFSLGSSL